MTEAENHGLIGAVENISGKLVSALPAPFLMLCLINAVFLFFVMHFIGGQMDARTAMANKLLDACIAETQHPRQERQ